MRYEVDVYNRQQFLDLKPDPAVLAIRFHTPFKDYSDDADPPEGEWARVVDITVDDCEHDNVPVIGDERGVQLFNREHAKEILEAVASHQGDIVVHCDGGFVRSVTVGRFLYDILGYSLSIHSPGKNVLKQGNNMIYNQLGRAFRQFFKAEVKA